MFGLYDDSQMRLQHNPNRCPYASRAVNFMLTLAETDQGLCQSYTDYVIAAAEEFGYNNIHQCKMHGHIYPIIHQSANNLRMIGLEAGYEDNDRLVIYYDGESHDLDWLLQDLRYSVVIPFPDEACQQYISDEETRVSKLIDKLMIPRVKTIRSLDKILLESLIALYAYGWGDVTPLFGEAVKNFMVLFETTPAPSKYVINNIDNSVGGQWDQYVHSLELVLSQRTFMLLLGCPFSVSIRMIAYQRSLPIVVEPRTDIDTFIAMTAIPYYRRTFFIFNQALAKTSSELDHTKILTEESEDIIGPTQVYVFKTSVDGMPYAELTESVEGMIISQINVLMRLVNPDDFDFVVYPADDEGLYSTYPDPPLTRDVAVFITEQLQEQFR